MRELDETIGAQNLTVDPSPVRAGKEGDNACNVLRRADPFERRHFGHAVDPLRRFSPQEKLGRHRPGGHGVGRDLPMSPPKVLAAITATS
jgi:hypothetical protein